MSTTELKSESRKSKQPEQQEAFYFLFVNKKSGNKVGNELLSSKRADLAFTCNSILVHFLPIDLYDKQQVREGFEQANQMSYSGKTVRIIICGGDGTIEWVLDQALKYKADFQNIVFGVVPIGTGNDFAESVGFKDYPYSGKTTQLKQLAAAFSECNVGTYDIWECLVECQSDGKITQIKNGHQVLLGQKRLVRNFTNYFGLGTDARICYIAQKLNAESVFMKKVAYGFAGTLSFFLQWGSLSRKISLKQKKYCEENEMPDKEEDLKTISDLEQSIEHTDLDNGQYETLKLGRFDQCVTFVNSTSSMELGHVWETPHSHNKGKNFKEQRVDDGKIEIVSYMNELYVLLERCMHMAKRVSQGKGPFKITFKKPNIKEANYIHINGEPYKIEGLREVVIEPSSNFPNGKIKVLTLKH